MSLCNGCSCAAVAMCRIEVILNVLGKLLLLYTAMKLITGMSTDKNAEIRNVEARKPSGIPRDTVSHALLSGKMKTWGGYGRGIREEPARRWLWGKRHLPELHLILASELVEVSHTVKQVKESFQALQADLGRRERL